MFNPNSETYYYVKDNMMLVDDGDWTDQGMGDALWRTGIAYITYKDQRLKDSILGCYRKFTMINKEDKYWYQASRYANRYREDDVSRDQVTVSLAALKVNGDEEELKEIVDHLPKRLSRRFKSTFVTRFWLKAITGKGNFYTFLFQLFELMELSVSFVNSKIIRWLFGWNKHYTQEWYCGYDQSIPFWTKENEEWKWIERGYHWVNNGHKLNNLYNKRLEESRLRRFADGLIFPDYATHLAAWMVYTSDDTFLKRMLQKLMLWYVEQDNLLIRLLMGGEVYNVEIEDYQPVRGYRWSVRFNGSTHKYYVEGDSMLYNPIDKDILISLKWK